MFYSILKHIIDPVFETKQMEKNIIQKKYKLLGVLGKGQFGTVCKGLVLKTQEPVAIKLEPSSMQVISLRHESMILRHLNNKRVSQIPQLYYYGPQDVYMCLVMTYYSEKSLDYYELELDHIYEWWTQACSILKSVHEHGVIHRDIKPENILIGPYGEVLLLDWGLAKVWHKNLLKIEDESEEAENDNEAGMTGEAKLQGTVMYMSPEQIARDPEIGFQADIYSLGAVLYEVLTGSTPFQGKIVRVLMDQIRSDLPNDAKKVGGGAVPNILADLAMQCLQKQPQHRPTCAAEIVRILKDDWAPTDLT